jgi:hypothetical protein
MYPVHFHLNIVAMLVKQLINARFYLIFHRINIDLFDEDEDVRDKLDQYFYRITMDEVMRRGDWIELIMMLMFELIVSMNRYSLFRFVL